MPRKRVTNTDPAASQAQPLPDAKTDGGSVGESKRTARSGRVARPGIAKPQSPAMKKPEIAESVPAQAAPPRIETPAAFPRKPETEPEQAATGTSDFSSELSVKEKIALLAYSYWQARGCQGGSPEEDWYRAEQEIVGQLALTRRQ